LIPVFSPQISIKDYLSVFSALKRTHISGTSPVIEEFENKLAEKFNRKYAVALSNGSNALDVALHSLELRENDEVALPSFTIISCLSAVIRSGAKPVFYDVNEKSWNAKLSDIEKVVTKKTKAIIMVHTFGLTSEGVRIQDYCKSNNIQLVEDSAEAHGQFIDNRPCGSFSDLSIFSFYANKHITTGEGGAVLTNSKEKYLKIKKMINLDFGIKRFQHENLFWNYRMSGLQASLGISQIDKLEKVIESKIKQGRNYNKLLFNLKDELSTPLSKNDGVENHYWVYGIVLKKNGLREKLQEKMYSEGIETRPFFWPLHLQNALPKKFESNNELPVSENIGKNGLYLPLGKHVNNSVQIKVVNSISSFFDRG